MFPGVTLLAGLVGLAMRRSRWRRPIRIAPQCTWVLTLGLVLRSTATGSRTGCPTDCCSALPASAVCADLIAVDRSDCAGHRSAGGLTRPGCIAACRPRGAVACRLLTGSGFLLAVNLLLPVPESTLGVSRQAQRALARIDQTRRPGETVMAVPDDCASNAFEFAIVPGVPPSPGSRMHGHVGRDPVACVVDAVPPSARLQRSALQHTVLRPAETPGRPAATDER